MIDGQVVAGLRNAAATYPGSDVEQLISDLASRDCTFAELWSAQDVYARTIGHKRFAIEGLGVITLQLETFSVDGAPGQTLFVYFPSRGSADEAALARVQAQP